MTLSLNHSLNHSACMDRRIGTRMPLNVRMTALWGDSERDYRTADLGLGGALVQRAKRAPPPLIHRLKLNIGQGEPLTALARTVWAIEGWHAVHFIGLTDVDRLDIAERLDAALRLSNHQRKLGAVPADLRNAIHYIPSDRPTFRGFRARRPRPEGARSVPADRPTWPGC